MSFQKILSALGFIGLVAISTYSIDVEAKEGTIARLLIDKGFGFIRDKDGNEFFFHRSSVKGSVFELMREGQQVTFDEEASSKGPRANNVRVVEIQSRNDNDSDNPKPVLRRQRTGTGNP